jgi:hypothetical protein
MSTDNNAPWGFQGYTMDQEGRYPDPVIVNNGDDLKLFLDENVEKHHELRVVDKEDLIVFHVIDQVLVFPIPEHGSSANKWNPESKMFESIHAKPTFVPPDALADLRNAVFGKKGN